MSKKLEMMVCAEPFAGDGFSVGRGQRFPADHPLVQRCPWAFVSESGGYPAMEQRRRENEAVTFARAAAVAEATERAMGTAQAKARDAETRAREGRAERIDSKPVYRPTDLVICAEQVGSPDRSAGLDDRGEPRGIFVGDFVPRTLRLVKRNPGAFVEVVPPGLEPDGAVVALQDLTHIVGKDVRRVFKGQWVSADDEIVQIQPHAFEPAAQDPRSVVSAAGGGLRELSVIAGPGQVTEG